MARNGRKWLLIVVVCVLYVLACRVVPAQGAADPNGGLRVWGLGDVTGEGQQELRVGWEGLLPDVELAVGGVHRDAPDAGVEEWPVRGYAIFHALDTAMIGQFVGQEWVLPDGTLYGGGFLEYCYDREDEWSGGIVLGGLVSWPRGWETVAEYQKSIFNTDLEGDLFVVGLRRAF